MLKTEVENVLVVNKGGIECQRRMAMCKKYYRIKLKDTWFYSQYRYWWMPFYITIDFSRVYTHAIFFIEEHKKNNVVYKECV